MLEAALVLPIMLILLFGIVEYGRCFMTLHMLNAGTREAARYAVAHTEDQTIDGTPGPATYDAVKQVFDKTYGLDSNHGSNVQSFEVYLANTATGSPIGNTNGTDWTKGQGGQYICVKAQVTFNSLFPTSKFILWSSTQGGLSANEKTLLPGQWTMTCLVPMRIEP